MIEGWRQDDYLILFDDAEAAAATARYGIAAYLPGFEIVGLNGWDDFILRDSTGALHTVPTVPLDPELVHPFTAPDVTAGLEQDPRLCGRIKWYVRPVVLGGDSDIGENLIWVDHATHAELVRWWNAKYLEVQPSSEANPWWKP